MAYYIWPWIFSSLITFGLAVLGWINFFNLTDCWLIIIIQLCFSYMLNAAIWLLIILLTRFFIIFLLILLTSLVNNFLAAVIMSFPVWLATAVVYLLVYYFDLLQIAGGLWSLLLFLFLTSQINLIFYHFCVLNNHRAIMSGY